VTQLLGPLAYWACIPAKSFWVSHRIASQYSLSRRQTQLPLGQMAASRAQMKIDELLPQLAP